MRFHWAVGFLWSCLVCSQALADGPDARAVLEKAAEAMRAVQAVQYEAEGRGEGILEQRLPPIRGDVTLLAIPGAAYPKLRIDAEVTPPGSQATHQAQVANDGKQVTVIDHGHNKYVSRDLPQGAVLLSSFTALLVREFTLDRPFERELEGVRHIYAGSETVGGVDCHVITVVYAEDGGSARWHFGKADHLPRQVRRIIPTPRGDAAITTSLSALNVAATASDELFRLERPQEYADVAAEAMMSPQAGTKPSLLPVGSEAPDWTLSTPTGKQVALKDLRGRVVLIDFWATWCGPCRMVMPYLQQLHERYEGEPVSIFGVNCWERQIGRRGGDPIDYMKRAGYSYPQLLNGDRVASAYRVSGIPTLYVIDPNGKILFAEAGFAPPLIDHLKQLIDRQLKTLSGGERTSSAGGPGR